MERLSKRDENGNAYYDFGFLNSNYWSRGKHIDRLAAYEDTGMEPEEINQFTRLEKMIGLDRLQELAEADRDGRLVVLPCKVGDTTATLIFYDGTEQFKTEGWVAEYIKVEEDDTVIHFHCFSTDDDEDRSISEIGKTVFIHSEAAEAALEAQR